MTPEEKIMFDELRKDGYTVEGAIKIIEANRGKQNEFIKT